MSAENGRKVPLVELVNIAKRRTFYPYLARQAIKHDYYPRIQKHEMIGDKISLERYRGM